MGKSLKWLFRTTIVVQIVLLTLEAWIGGEIPFASLRVVTVRSSLSGLYRGILAAGPKLELHVVGSLLLLALGAALIALAFRRAGSTGLKVFSILGLVSIVVITNAGVRFALSGFQNTSDAKLMEWGTLGIYLPYIIGLFIR